MASQTSSSFSTEGTQYAKDNSYYLLDSAPGAGISIVAPVTIAGAPGTPGLIVQGTTTLAQTGALSLNTNTITAGPAAATYAASGNLTVTSNAALSLTGVNTTLASSAATVINGPRIDMITTAAGGINLTAGGAGDVTLTASGSGPVSVVSANASATLQSIPAGSITIAPSVAGSPAINVNSIGPMNTLVTGGNQVNAVSGGSITTNVTGAGAFMSTNVSGSYSAAIRDNITMQSTLGNVLVESQAGTLSLLSVGNTNLQSSAGAVTLQGFTTSSISAQGQIVVTYNDAFLAANAYGVEVFGKTRLRNGFAALTGQGTFAAPATATSVGPGHTFQMTGNKAFITTGGASTTLIVSFLTSGQNYIAQVGQIGATATNVGSVVQNGDTVIIGPVNPLNPMVVSILVL
jgi:filamentous hemagglutinin